MQNFAVYAGTKQPLRQRLINRWSPLNGLTQTTEWMGFGDDEMNALAQQAADAGFEYEYIDDHGVFHLTAVDTSGAVTADTWEIGAQEELVSSLKNPLHTNQDLATAVSSNDIQIISRAIQDGVTLEEARTLLIHDRGTNNGTAFTAVAIGDTSAQRLYKRLKNDQTGYFDSRYILRHTTNVSNRWAVNVADLNVNRIYTTAQLLSEVQNALSWVFPLPPRLAYKITALASAFIADYGTQPDADHYQIGWLKSASPEQSAGNNRVNIVTEYKFYSWSTDEYLLAT